MRKDLLEWQWSIYPVGHRSRTNLLLHLASAPVFMLGTIGLVVGIAMLQAAVVVASPPALALVLAIQGRGHAMEAVAAEPFLGPADFVGRFFVEQWVTFPRFVLSGGWARNVRAVR